MRDNGQVELVDSSTLDALTTKALPSSSWWSCNNPAFTDERPYRPRGEMGMMEIELQ